MPVQNSEVARIFDEYADLLEIYGANEYRVRAYRSAARNISYLSENLEDMVKQGEDLTRLPGIAEDLAGKIVQMVKTRHLSQLEELKKEIPEELVRITHIAGIGPKRAHRLYYGAGISNIKELEQAARAGKIKDIPGFGIKAEQAILEDIERRGAEYEQYPILYSAAEDLVQPLLAYLWEAPGIIRLESAGGYRRGTDAVGSLKIVAVTEDDSALIEQLAGYEEVKNVISRDSSHITVSLYSGFPIDLYCTSADRFGAVLFSFTGSIPHCTAIRKLGARHRLKISEEGVFKGEQLLATENEDEVYSLVGLPYIEPELRENRGEIEAARSNHLPQLIELKDIRGDLHVHTRYTDGRFSLEEMARAAQDKGYEYLAISEHSHHLTVAHGLNPDRLAEQMREIDKLNRGFNNFILLKGIEVDIMDDGSLDLPDSILRKLDLVIGAVHHKFNLSKEKQTERIIRAMHNPYFTILAHPTGRLINDREPYEVDVERLIRSARETGCILELNSQPERLDLDDVYCKTARDMGVMITISSDSHSLNDLNFMRYGIIQGRRGWLSNANVLNSMSWLNLKRTLDKLRSEKQLKVGHLTKSVEKVTTSK